MKSKKIESKLVLKKETISSLDTLKMSNVKGGEIVSFFNTCTWALTACGSCPAC